MKLFSKAFVATAFLFAVMGVSLTKAVAQTNPATPRAGMRPVADVLARISQGTGVVAVADSTVQRLRVPLLSGAPTAQNVEKQLIEVVKALPEGTTWTKLYLPLPTSGRWNGDDLAAYAQAQSRLFASAAPMPAGIVEILGQRLPAERAREYIVGLNLRTVYVISNPQARLAASRGSNSLVQLAQMTPEQVQQQAAQIVNMDPALRNQMMRQMVSVFAQAMGQLSPEQRQQMFQGTGLALTSSGITAAPAGAGNP